jgi:hypothetical protein
MTPSLIMLMLLLCVGGCAMGPQPYLDAPHKTLSERQTDAVECQALAAQAATGAGAWSRDRAIRAAIYDNARDQYLAQCLQGRGWTGQNSVSREEHPQEQARLDAQTRLPPSGSAAAGAPSSPPLGPGTREAVRPVAVDISPGSSVYLDFKNGFRDLKFGDPPPHEMQVVEDGVTTFYKRPADDLVIGNATLHGLTYGFYKGRLSSVLLETKGLVNSRALLEVLRQAYGSGHRSNQFMDRYSWHGRRVTLIYDEKPITNDADVLFESVTLKNEREADEKAKARQGVSGL